LIKNGDFKDIYIKNLRETLMCYFYATLDAKKMPSSTFFPEK